MEEHIAHNQNTTGFKNISQKKLHTQKNIFAIEESKIKKNMLPMNFSRSHKSKELLQKLLKYQTMRRKRNTANISFQDKRLGIILRHLGGAAREAVPSEGRGREGRAQEPRRRDFRNGRH